MTDCVLSTAVVSRVNLLFRLVNRVGIVDDSFGQWAVFCSCPSTSLNRFLALCLFHRLPEPVPEPKLGAGDECNLTMVMIKLAAGEWEFAKARAMS